MVKTIILNQSKDINDQNEFKKNEYQENSKGFRKHFTT